MSAIKLKPIYDYLESTGFYGIDHVGSTSTNGDDIIFVPPGGTMNGLGGNDTLIGADGGDVQMNGNAGNDKLVLGTGHNTVAGGDGDDILVLQGDHGTGRVSGNAGTDIFQLNYNGDGENTVVGFESGIDHFKFAGYDITGFVESQVSLNGFARIGGDTLDFTPTGGASHDHGSSSVSALALGDMFNWLKAEGTNGIDNVFVGAGNSNGNDVILLNDGNNVINGLGGNDTIVAGSGDNRMLGNAGNDTLVLGSGNNQATGGDGNDNFVYSGNAGTSRVNGNTGSDTFQVEHGAHGTTTVVGFEAGVDHFTYDGYDVTDLVTQQISLNGHASLGDLGIFFA